MGVLHRISATGLLLFSMVASMVAFVPVGAFADEPIRNWWRDARYDRDWGKPCEIKYEKRKDGYKREVRCRNGVNASWRGDWTEVFQEGPCKVRLEARLETFKEEVKCDPR